MREVTEMLNQLDAAVATEAMSLLRKDSDLDQRIWLSRIFSGLLRITHHE